jgi:hypothetical protein
MYLTLVEEQVQSGLELAADSGDVDVELALLEKFNSNLEKVAPLRTANLLREATIALERHVADRSGQTFNDYLYTHGLKVGQDFADLSSALGSPINLQNIE